MSAVETVTITVTFAFNFDVKELGYEDDPVGRAVDQVEQMFEGVPVEPDEVKVETQ